MTSSRLFPFILCACLFCGAGVFAADPRDFPRWVEAFRKKAGAALPPEQVERALLGVQYLPAVIEADQRQPEFVRSFWRYYEAALSEKRIAEGRRLMRERAATLERIGREYGVQPHVLLAFWGMETNYGTYWGAHPMISALATLAFDERRSAFFTRELLAAIKIMADGHVPHDTMSSWAGAFGNFQFMPTTFERYALDGDGDGKIDLFGSLEDSLASAANYLRALGWREKEKWGRPVKLGHETGELWALVNSYEQRSVAEFGALGVVAYDGSALPPSTTRAYLVAPNGAAAPMFLIYDNFALVMKWNASQSYALSVCLLSDEIAGRGARLEKPEGAGLAAPLSIEDVRDIQRRLLNLNLYSGAADGRLGRATIRAVKAYQSLLIEGDMRVSASGAKILTYPDGSRIVPDGYPNPELYGLLKSMTGEDARI